MNHHWEPSVESLEAINSWKIILYTIAFSLIISLCIVFPDKTKITRRIVYSLIISLYIVFPDITKPMRHFFHRQYYRFENRHIKPVASNIVATLPAELLQEISDHCSVDTIAALSLVNRRFNQVLEARLGKHSVKTLGSVQGYMVVHVPTRRRNGGGKMNTGDWNGVAAL
jgi:hypothetical protein